MLMAASPGQNSTRDHSTGLALDDGGFDDVRRVAREVGVVGDDMPHLQSLLLKNLALCGPVFSLVR